MTTYHVENFGCRASQADGEAMARQLGAAAGAPGVSSAPTVVVVNTCSVTREAEKTARAYIRRLRRDQPGVRVVVTGCYAQRAPEEVAALPGVDLVVGNSHKGLVAELARGTAGTGFVPANALAPIVADDFAHSDLSTLPLACVAGERGRTRPVLKVQDGCANRCSFCIIPTTRGPSRSMPLVDCVKAAQEFAAAGGQELVVSGINLGRWGRDLATRGTLAGLLSALLEQTTVPRLRLSSVEPMDWTNELFELFGEDGRAASPRLARHFHVPLQSGSDRILRAMHRRYRPWHYAAKMARMRELAPLAAIGADVMVGFPGESDQLFGESCDFIARQPLTYLHLFPFSARPGTPAAALPPVHPKQVSERMQALRALMRDKEAAFARTLAGRTVSAVTLAGGGRALTDNFQSVELSTRDGERIALPPNRMIDVQLAGISSNEDGSTFLRAVPIAELGSGHRRPALFYSGPEFGAQC